MNASRHLSSMRSLSFLQVCQKKKVDTRTSKVPTTSSTSVWCLLCVYTFLPSGSAIKILKFQTLSFFFRLTPGTLKHHRHSVVHNKKNIQCTLIFNTLISKATGVLVWNHCYVLPSGNTVLHSFICSCTRKFKSYNLSNSQLSVLLLITQSALINLLRVNILKTLYEGYCLI